MIVRRTYLKAQYVHAVEYYSAIKRNKCESVVLRWMNLEPVCYKSEREKYVLTYIWNLEKWYG